MRMRWAEWQASGTAARVLLLGAFLGATSELQGAGRARAAGLMSGEHHSCEHASCTAAWPRHVMAVVCCCGACARWRTHVCKRDAILLHAHAAHAHHASPPAAAPAAAAGGAAAAAVAAAPLPAAVAPARARASASAGRPSRLLPGRQPSSAARQVRTRSRSTPAAAAAARRAGRHAEWQQSSHKHRRRSGTQQQARAPPAHLAPARARRPRP